MERGIDSNNYSNNLSIKTFKHIEYINYQFYTKKCVVIVVYIVLLSMLHHCSIKILILLRRETIRLSLAPRKYD